MGLNIPVRERIMVKVLGKLGPLYLSKYFLVSSFLALYLSSEAFGALQISTINESNHYYDELFKASHQYISLYKDYLEINKATSDQLTQLNHKMHQSSVPYSNSLNHQELLQTSIDQQDHKMISLQKNLEEIEATIKKIQSQIDAKIRPSTIEALKQRIDDLGNEIKKKESGLEYFHLKIQSNVLDKILNDHWVRYVTLEKMIAQTRGDMAMLKNRYQLESNDLMELKKILHIIDLRYIQIIKELRLAKEEIPRIDKQYQYLEQTLVELSLERDSLIQKINKMTSQHTTSSNDLEHLESIKIQLSETLVPFQLLQAKRHENQKHQIQLEQNKLQFHQQMKNILKEIDHQEFELILYSEFVRHHDLALQELLSKHQKLEITIKRLSDRHYVATKRLASYEEQHMASLKSELKNALSSLDNENINIHYIDDQKFQSESMSQDLRALGKKKEDLLKQLTELTQLKSQMLVELDLEKKKGHDLKKDILPLQFQINQANEEQEQIKQEMKKAEFLFDGISNNLLKSQSEIQVQPSSINSTFFINRWPIEHDGFHEFWSINTCRMSGYRMQTIEENTTGPLDDFVPTIEIVLMRHPELGILEPVILFTAPFNQNVVKANLAFTEINRDFSLIISPTSISSDQDNDNHILVIRSQDVNSILEILHSSSKATLSLKGPQHQNLNTTTINFNGFNTHYDQFIQSCRK